MVNPSYNYTIRYLNADGSVWKTTSGSHRGGTNVVLDSGHPSLDNHYFVNWTYSNDGRTYNPGDYVLVPYSKDVVVTLTPNWGQSIATIHYDTQGGSAFNDTVIGHAGTSGTVTVTLPSNVPTLADHTFQHWYYNGGTYVAGSQITIGYASYVTLTAVWKRTTYYTTVIYDNNGGSGAPNNQVEPHNQTSGTCTVWLNNTHYPTRAGWLFGGWTVKGEVKAPGSAITLAYNETVTVYAYWYQNVAAISYDTVGQGTLDNTEVRNVQTSGQVDVTVRSDVPSKKYYVFKHWKDSSGNTYSPGQTVRVGYNSTLALSAVYDHAKVTVTLNSQYGSGSQSFTQDQGTTITLTEMEEDGYVHKGWSETDGGQIRYPPSGTVSVETEDVILWAVWNTAFAEEVMYLANGNSLHLADVTWYPADRRTQEIGPGEDDVYLDDLGYGNVQFVPSELVSRYPLAFGVSPSDMVAVNNPDLVYSNVVHDSTLTIKFPQQAGGYLRDTVTFAVIDLASMTGFILSCYLSQETDTTNYTIKLMRSPTDPNPTVYSMVGSYRNPSVFTFPMIEDGNLLLDKWVSDDTGAEYDAGDTLTLTGRYITAEQVLTFISRMVARPTVLRFSLQGGRNGPGTMSIDAETTATFTIPSIVPTRRGYTFRGWISAADGSTLWHAGEKLTAPAGSTTILYASWEAHYTPFSAQGKLYTPFCGIRIWMEKDSKRYYFNATFWQKEGGMAVISKAENRPGSASFTLYNDFDTPSKNMCSDTFAQWREEGSEQISNVTGAVEPGMYVELLDVQTETTAVLMMDGRLTTITPSVDSISFEMGDGITFLSKTGTWLRRNYRAKHTQDVTNPEGRIVDNKLVVPLDSIGGAPSAAYRRRTAEYEVKMSGSSVPGDKVGGTISNKQGSTVCTFLRRVMVKLKWGAYLMPFAPDVSLTIRITCEGTEYSSHKKGKNVWGGGDSQTFTIELKKKITQDVAIVVTPRAGDWKGVEVEWVKVWMDSEELVSASGQSYTDDADDYDSEDPTFRLKIIYLADTLSTASIMSMIAASVGHSVPDPLTLPPSPKLALFRAGGSYAQTYLQKLADQEKDGVGPLAYAVEGASPRLYIGKRYKVTDTPVAVLKYGGDQTIEGYENGRTYEISEFLPKRTLKNRPNLVTLKANLSDDNQSVNITFEDLSSRKLRSDLTIETILADSNVSTLEGVGAAALGALRGNELDQWEGEVTIPGIVEMMGRPGTEYAGSGVPLYINDRRYGLSAYRTRVRQVVYDYNTCTTKVTVGNYDLVYSSGISATNALAVEVSDMVGGISDTTLYNQQYVYIREEDHIWSPSTSNKVYIKADGRDYVEADEAKVFGLPNDTCVIAATVKATALTCLPHTADYGITKVKLEGASRLEIDIDEDRRPDFYLGQSLTICVVIKTKV